VSEVPESIFEAQPKTQTRTFGADRCPSGEIQVFLGAQLVIPVSQRSGQNLTKVWENIEPLSALLVFLLDFIYLMLRFEMEHLVLKF